MDLVDLNIAYRFLLLIFLEFIHISRLQRAFTNYMYYMKRWFQKGSGTFPSKNLCIETKRNRCKYNIRIQKDSA